MDDRTDDIPRLALDWHRAGRGAAIATVVETWGSAPRPVGSQLVIDREGAMEGSVSGGCVEGAVIVEAIEALDEGRTRLLDYGVSDDEAFAVGLACGGRIRVHVDTVGGTLPEQTLARLVEARDARQAIGLSVDLEGVSRELIGPDAAPERFRLDRSGIEPDERTFIGVHNPPLRMVIVGAVHIAQPLVVMARLAGYDPVIIDPRPAFGAAARFPGETILDDWPDEALAAHGLDPRTAVITLTHDPKLDDPAIVTALRSEVFYLGCLGSTRTHAKRVARLEEAGFGAGDIARIHAPVGLDIGGRSPAEIAVSIMAEVTRTLRRG
ncbi:XdhC family protein [Ponticoccus sp. SC2-23]|uniref:XdhC family protein n=1 Tax=Alexandriicola marinus TaxID=2081710 RepID=UPI000FDA14EA|nr:XdhC/CoxI family protein [Alexandriicola marinus]MBM1219352.1 XdhC family protein [Ponticoccus sp. SC6-9]MBM1223576.1 XdhC family protein [Ponticoccus sp. SC6-15]MBM1229165.1 XdhC family protein [Ponticoccus sp. SC6-38]MBM1232542.1 XdhC family protein [Ponticoccus sp. SC6-45]MBM1237508.1 XdhC family protein [Ponticoccus sp. SC6-49]MBM1241553.1 XdhC family protein [Ponticoccus sp. SC2-64]MBM1246066.1 XdhC family protein [Ponticoccus sp. SC6-42]MBM1250544.1 XdhC family protein [Ponticoccus